MNSAKKMRIALLGTRGVPARYGGFETCAEEIGKRLAAKGHDVLVYCRKGLYPEKKKEYCGMKLVYLPAFKWKPLETLSHTFLSIFNTVGKRADIYLVFNVANSPLLFILLLFKRKVLLNVDGFEWRRSKWSYLGKKYYQFSAWLAAKLSCELVADSHEIKRYYEEKYGRRLHYIAYGAFPQSSRNPSLLAQYGLDPQEYFLQITRFEPENNPLLSIEAFMGLETEKKFVLVGGSNYKTHYSAQIYSVKDKRIKILGFIYNPDILRELLCNCLAYVHGNEVGGTNPALLNAMASGCFVLARDVPFNREVLQVGGGYFGKDINDLREKLAWVLKYSQEAKKLAERGTRIIKEHYDWDSVVSEYEKLFNLNDS